jgi:hypothetical protein
MAGLVPFGWWTKHYSGPFDQWVNHSLGGVLYVVFWCLAFSLLFPRVRPRKLSGWVFLATSAIEVLQLWHPHWLEALRATRMGVTLLGNSFAWLDFPHYLLGALLSCLLLHTLQHRTGIRGT